MVAFTTIVALLCAAWSDLATRRIPDSACIAIVAAGSVGRVMVGPAALAWSVGLSAILFWVLVLAHARGVLGGGDVKLLSATMIGLPPEASLHLLTATAISGGVLALLYLALRRLPDPAPRSSPTPPLRRVCTVERWRIRRHGPLPYGVAIAGGGVWTLLSHIGS
jgi:prepilin peptidase CpaA